MGTITRSFANLITASGPSALPEGLAGTMTPFFSASITSNQNVTNNTVTKVAFATEQFDTDSAYDASTNYRFTVPSGKAGKYFFTAMVTAEAEGTVFSNAYISFSINTVQKTQPFWYGGGPSTNVFSSVKYLPLNVSATYDLIVGDYVEVLVYLAKDAGGGTHILLNGINQSHFSGFKLI